MTKCPHCQTPKEREEYCRKRRVFANTFNMSPIHMMKKLHGYLTTRLSFFEDGRNDKDTFCIDQYMLFALEDLYDFNKKYHEEIYTKCTCWGYITPMDKDVLSEEEILGHMMSLAVNGNRRMLSMILHEDELTDIQEVKLERIMSVVTSNMSKRHLRDELEMILDNNKTANKMRDIINS